MESLFIYIKCTENNLVVLLYKYERLNNIYIRIYNGYG